MFDSFVNAFCRHARHDKRLVLLYTDCGPPSLLAAARELPTQIINVGIAECTSVALSAGAALAGLSPVVLGISSFLLPRAFEQIRNTLVLDGANVKLVGMGAGLAFGRHGFSHQALDDIGLARLLKGLRVASPAYAGEVEPWVDRILGDANPWYLRLYCNEQGDASPDPVEDSRAAELRQWRDGTDLLMLTSGPLVRRLLRVADALSLSGVSAAVMSTTLLQPLPDEALTREIAKRPALMVVDEQLPASGLEVSIRELVQRQGLVRPSVFLGLMATGQAHASTGELYDHHGLSVSSLVRQAKDLAIRAGRPGPPTLREDE